MPITSVRVLDFKVQIRSGLPCDEWEAVAGPALSFSRGSRHYRRERMSKRTLCLAAALVILAAWHVTAPALACKARPHSTSLCTVVSASADVRDEPNGRVEYAATGKVLVAGYSKNGLWARIEVPCIGFIGWIARKDFACEGITVSAREAAKP